MKDNSLSGDFQSAVCMVLLMGLQKLRPFSLSLEVAILALNVVKGRKSIHVRCVLNVYLLYALLFKVCFQFCNTGHSLLFCKNKFYCFYF